MGMIGCRPVEMWKWLGEMCGQTCSFFYPFVVAIIKHSNSHNILSKIYCAVYDEKNMAC